MATLEVFQHVSQLLRRRFWFEREDTIDDMVCSSLVDPVEVPGLGRGFEWPHDDPCGIRTQKQGLPVEKHRMRQCGPLVQCHSLTGRQALNASDGDKLEGAATNRARLD